MSFTAMSRDECSAITKQANDSKRGTLMSTPAEKVTDEINALELSPQEMKKRRPSGKHPYKPHVATTIKWALEDIMNWSMEADERMQKMWQWMEEARQVADATGDTTLLALLGKFDHEMGGLALSVGRIALKAAMTTASAKPESKSE